MGSSVPAAPMAASTDLLRMRMDGLLKVAQNRVKEICALQEQWAGVKAQVDLKFDGLESKLSAKPSKLAAIEGEIVGILAQQLEELKAW
jgi:hypothetical protein